MNPQKSDKRDLENNQYLEQRVRDLFDEVEELKQRLNERHVKELAFLRDLSHELRSHLNATLGFSDILLSGMDGELTPSQKKDVEMIYRSSRHLFEILNDFLDIARIRTGRLDLRREKMETRVLLMDLLHDLREQMQDTGPALRLDLPDDLPPVPGDPVRFRQIVRKLVRCIAQCSPGGEILIRAVRETTGESPSATPREEIRILLYSGSGPNAKKEQTVKALFENFHQIESGEPLHYEGMVLPLLLATALVKIHDGKSGLEETTDGRICLWFALPTKLRKNPE